MAPRAVCNDAIALIKSFEGDATQPYLDPVGIWTIGWGHAIKWQGQYLRGSGVLQQVKALYPYGITVDQAENLLSGDLMETGAGVLAIVSVTLTDNQYGALTSFAFNLGVSKLHSSTLLKDVNAKNFSAAANEFPRWCYANGKPFPGLLNRRNAERELFLRP
jgi:lysozyme